MDPKVTFISIPAYAADLLVEAKLVLAAVDDPAVLPQAIRQLEWAVGQFEKRMPVCDGVIQCR